MKSKYSLTTIFGLSIALLLFFSTCKKEETDNESENENPTISITNPSDGVTITQGDTITILASANDIDGNITKVRFYIDNEEKESVSNLPYTYLWNTNEDSIGSHTIKVTAIDNDGGVSSDEKTIILNGLQPIAEFTADQIVVAEGDTITFNDLSINNPNHWVWNFGEGGSSTLQNPTYIYNTIGTYTVSLNVSNNFGSDTETKTNFITVNSATLVYNDVYNPTTGKVWLDRNLGATQVATSSTDADAYGDLYQWGRNRDGHENRTSATSSSLSNQDTSQHPKFIITNNHPWDWRIPQNDNLWQGVNGINNPCPNGYRIPTEAEWQAEFLSWSSAGTAGAISSTLKLPATGIRFYQDGSIVDEGYAGFYWSSTIDNNDAIHLYFSNSGSISTNTSYRAAGISVRCIKE